MPVRASISPSVKRSQSPGVDRSVSHSPSHDEDAGATDPRAVPRAVPPPLRLPRGRDPQRLQCGRTQKLSPRRHFDGRGAGETNTI